MAIRNLDAITRRGNMVKEQIQNARTIKEENFWNRVNFIRKSHEDAIDAIDTIRALRANKLGKLFDEWMAQQDVKFLRDFNIFLLYASQGTWVGYNPNENFVEFHSNRNGMHETYRTNTEYIGHFIHMYLDEKNYDGGLTLLAERLQPFLDSFFSWVETL